MDTEMDRYVRKQVWKVNLESSCWDYGYSLYNSLNFNVRLKNFKTTSGRENFQDVVDIQPGLGTTLHHWYRIRSRWDQEAQKEKNFTLKKKKSRTLPKEKSRDFGATAKKTKRQTEFQ